MRLIFTPLFTGMAILISTAAFSQAVTQSTFPQVPTPQSNISRLPVIAKDNLGNIYMATTAHQNTNQGDFLIAKYNQTNTVGFIVFYSTPGFQDDEVTAITVDPSGNAIVTGFTQVGTNQGGPITYATTVKYNFDGSVMWALQSEYGQSSTTPTCITTDTAGNIYVGATMGDTTATGKDFLVFKITPDGQPSWAVSYNGTANNIDKVTAIATDVAGNIYVTGESMGQAKLTLPRGGTATFPQGYDIVTIKYNPSGQPLWNNRFATNAADIPTSLTLDAANNAYVTGSSNGAGITISYNPAGARQWVANSTTAQNYTSIALDSSGNVVTGGYAIDSGVLNYAVTKYTAAGSLVWSKIVGAGFYVPLSYGPNLALATDRQNAIYITGESNSSQSDTVLNLNFWTAKFISNGGMVWSLTYDGGLSAGDIPSGITLIEPASHSPTTYASVFVCGFNGITPANPNQCSLALIKYTQTVRKLPLSSDPETATAELTAITTPNAGLANYPNPFHGATTITYTLPHDSHVTLQIYDLRGRTLATPLDDNEPAGPHTLPFNATRLAPGIYEYRIVATSPQGNFITTKQMIIQ